jgi:hypothetical protein
MRLEAMAEINNPQYPSGEAPLPLVHSLVLIEFLWLACAMLLVAGTEQTTSYAYQEHADSID